MAFDRWKCWWPKTWPFRVFKKHHTQLNAIYWVHRSASNFILKTARGQSDETLTSSIFPLSQNDVRRQKENINEWIGDYKEFSTWARLSAAVSLASYLEVYLQSIVPLALESDPGALLGVSHSVDGLKILKMKPGYSYADRVTPVVKGTWHERVNAYREYFGKAPSQLEFAIGDLEALRKLRNGVGHAFGRNIDDYKSSAIFDIKPLQSLSEDRLKKWLGIVESVVVSIDDHLRIEHIGSYEALSYYHTWKSQYKPGRLTESDTFKSHLLSSIKNGPSEEYIKELLTYYNHV